MVLGESNKKDKIVYERIGFNNDLPILIIYPDKMRDLLEKKPEEIFVDHHWHRSLEILYTKESDGYLIINGEKKYLEPQTITLVNSKDIHYIEETHPSESYHGCAIQISYQFLKEYYPEIDHLYFEICKKNKEFTTNLLNVIIDLYFDDAYKNREIIINLLKALMEYFIQYCARLRVFDRKIKNSKLIEIIDYLEANYNHELDLTLVAKKFDMSYTYMAKLFKEHLGKSAGQYVNKLRYEKALIDVATTSETITDIAYKHGFPSASIFIKEFRKVKGVSPKQYRKMLEE